MQTWFFPSEGEGSGVNSHPPQNIEQVVEAQEADYAKREAEIAAAARENKQQVQFEHFVTSLTK